MVVNKKICLLLMLIAVSHFLCLHGRVNVLQSEREFEQRIGKDPLVVVLFYKSTKQERKNKALKSNIDWLDNEFDIISNKKIYKDAGVTFVKINVMRKEMEKIAHTYGVTQAPVIILFYKDKIVTDENGSPAMLAGFDSRSEMKDFIEYYLKKPIKKILSAKYSALKKRKAADADAWIPYYYPYDYYEPYYDYYWHRPIYYPGSGIGMHYHRHWR